VILQQYFTIEKYIFDNRRRCIKKSIKEVGYVEEIKDDEYYSKSLLWFYGEL
jgi:hypothetical protein